MGIKEAMFQRHTVRKYLKKELSKDVIESLTNRIDENNKKNGLNMKLMINDEGAISPIFKLILAKGVRNYIILSGNESSDLDEKLGYSGADIMLYAQTLGLNTWWVGGTFNRNVSKHVDNKKVIGLIAVGYGQNQGVKHKSKTLEAVSKYEGDMPEWFKEGVNSALLAPTALNKQDFMITGKTNKVSISYNNSVYANANVGLIKYHFEMGAGKENFEWE